tara:strand:- start:2799 stop:3359 length:561 start_codon:yes stop_codon:yes gene_type:complete
MAKMLSISARKTKSFRGARAFIAKSPIKVDDDEHESNIKAKEKFYLKKLGTRFYLIDVERERGKDVWYQFKIDEKLFQSLQKKHQKISSPKTKAKAKPKSRTTKAKPRPKTSKVSDQIAKFKKSGIKSPKDFQSFTKALKDAGYSPGKPEKGADDIYRLPLTNKAGKRVVFKYNAPKNKHIQTLLK